MYIDQTAKLVWEKGVTGLFTFEAKWINHLIFTSVLLNYITKITFLMIKSKLLFQERSFLVTNKDLFASTVESVFIIYIGCQGKGRFSNVMITTL